MKQRASVHWWRPSGRRCHRTGSSRPDGSRTGVASRAGRTGGDVLRGGGGRPRRIAWTSCPAAAGVAARRCSGGRASHRPRHRRVALAPRCIRGAPAASAPVDPGVSPVPPIPAVRTRARIPSSHHVRSPSAPSNVWFNRPRHAPGHDPPLTQPGERQGALCQLASWDRRRGARLVHTSAASICARSAGTCAIGQSVRVASAGDDPIDDIVVFGPPVLSPEADSLVADIAALGGRRILEDRHVASSPAGDTAGGAAACGPQVYDRSRTSPARICRCSAACDVKVITGPSVTARGSPRRTRELPLWSCRPPRPRR